MIRHALSAVDPNVDSREWGLAPGALEEAEDLARVLPPDIHDTVWTSSERKAVETAGAIARVRGLRIDIDDRFGEVRRPWTGGDYSAEARRYLSGDVPDGWEPPDDVVRRFSDAMNALPSEAVAVVDHGLALSMYVASIVSVDRPKFWAALTFPDAWLLDVPGGSVTRLLDQT